MKVIALVGAENTGKSHTINLAYAFLLRDGYTQVPEHFRTLGNPVYEDCIDILEKDHLKIAIIGLGDYIRGKETSLKNLLKEAQGKGCDITICACRYNAEKTAILEAVKEYPDHSLVHKTLSTGRANDRIVNVADATTLLSYI